MKVQTKITLLLLLVVATFMAGLWSFRLYDRARFRRIAEQRYSERNRSFEDFLAYHGEALKTLAEYDTCWDQMVQAIEKSDYQWFGENVNSSTLEGYHANAIWIYRPDGTLVYPLNNLNSSKLEEIPVPHEAFARIFATEPFAHFFIKLSEGIMEIRAATIHPSKDYARKTLPAGFCFVGRVWNTPTLQEMSMFSSNDIQIVPAGEQVKEMRHEESTGTIVFSRPLNGWDKKLLAHLIIRNESRIVRELNLSSERLLLSFVLFAVVLLLLISSALVRWVSQPLGQIMESLNRNDLKPIEKLTVRKAAAHV